MAKSRVILVTGVAGYWGAQIAGRLIEEAERPLDAPVKRGGARARRQKFHIIGLDANFPKQDLKGLDFIQADIRNPFLLDLLRLEEVDTVCHLVFMESNRPSEASFDLNVMGTMKVLGACAEAGVRKVVLMSSTAVYGAQSTNPAFMTEEQPLQGSRSYGYTRDMVEIESFCNGFQRQFPEMILTILRFPSIIGPTVNTPMTRFLREPLAPVLWGFDPMMQLIHEMDVVDAFVHAILVDAPGVFNVADEGILPLTKLIALAGKLPVPIFHLFAYWGTGILASGGLRGTRYTPIELDYLRYAWVADLQKMRDEFGFVPRHTIEETLREFAGLQRLRRYMPESAALAYDEERLRDIIERRRYAKGRETGKPVGKVENGSQEKDPKNT